jgi:hypothetical protein
MAHVLAVGGSDAVIEMVIKHYENDVCNTIPLGAVDINSMRLFECTHEACNQLRLHVLTDTLSTLEPVKTGVLLVIGIRTEAEVAAITTWAGESSNVKVCLVRNGGEGEVGVVDLFPAPHDELLFVNKEQLLRDIAFRLTH